ncbi:VOC family protein [Croceicoccus sp. BE223]|uniref:VOC family protein n=1 Tax=Croceicoccus sp. BE223 TaxID=2817716 RepID=UPI00285A9BFA|nr:VOC family protein [Croceicoccus sp. BE223]MDR7103663.1 glyoxylase I family protein [Croceicoccus sp. BE223]
MTPRYNHVCLTVGDLDRSVEFYSSRFGLSVQRRDGPHEGPRVDCMTGVEDAALDVAFLSDGNFILELICFTRSAGEHCRALPANEVGSPHLAFVTDDVRGLYESWRADGVHFLSEPTYSKGRDAYSVMLTDPDGIMIEMLEHSALCDDQLKRARREHTDVA